MNPLSFLEPIWFPRLSGSSVLRDFGYRNDRFSNGQCLEAAWQRDILEALAIPPTKLQCLEAAWQLDALQALVEIRT